MSKIDVDDMLPMSSDLSDKMEAIMRMTASLIDHPPRAAAAPATMQKLSLGLVQQIVACCKQHGYPIEDFLRQLIAPPRTPVKNIDPGHQFDMEL